MNRQSIYLWCVLFTSATSANETDLYRLIHDRLNLMDEVAAYKWINKLPIEDLARESVVLEKAAARSLNYGIRIEDARHFFAQQIR